MPFGRDDFRRLADVMGAVKGKAILSINDHPDIRVIFAAFQHEVLTIDYTVGGADHRVARRELIIYSWDRDADPAGLF